jgi:vacuolar-type H+-ATPase subunit I/STV1
MGGSIVSKAITTAVNPATDQAGGTPPKVGKSKFDKVRASLQDSQAAEVKMPPEVQQVPQEKAKLLQAELSNRLKNTSAQHVFAADIKRVSGSLQQLTHRVSALPKTPALDPLRQRLASLDAQYQATGRLVSSVSGSSSPADLMKIQMQMYQLTENLELASKVVDQVTSGVKSVLQTQV